MSVDIINLNTNDAWTLDKVQSKSCQVKSRCEAKTMCSSQQSHSANSQR